MKKTLTINLNKIVFNIDEDAYDLLQAYLSDVNHHLNSEEGKAEIISDIEARIAELFSERLGKSKNVIISEDVNHIVSVMGKPDQFSDDKEKYDEEKPNETGEKANTNSRHFYRDMDNGLLSGICAGLAAYLGWDATLVRIILVVLVLIGLGSIIPIYLVLWVIIPRAETTTQKMAMRGEVVNIETIKNKMNDAKNYLESDKFKESATNTGNKFMQFFQAILKVLITLVGVLFTVIGVVIAGALIFSLVIFLFQPEIFIDIDPNIYRILEGISTEKISLLILSILFIVGCPIFALVYWSIRARTTGRATSNTPFWIALILWFAGIFMFLSVGAETFRAFKTNFQKIDNENYSRSNNPKWFVENRIATHPFYAIEALGVMDIELTYQNEKTIEVSTVKEYLPKIKTEVENGILKIYSSDLLIKPKIKIRVGMDSLTALYLQGATKINFKNVFPVKNIRIEMSGASKGNLNLSAERVKTELSGASKLEIRGFTNLLETEASGASKIDANDLTANQADIRLSGASKAIVRVKENFTGNADGASNIVCKGNPEVRKSVTNGSSNIDFQDID